ncbi:hypothetical protein GIB67_035747 [Kingdonia uniflora]|uniref:Uncharacterized protein n=1 Tax=Kingdonia uniflora TaxID=39325 RepID=A0A7J7MJN4_9MAGN|nr:hypothetical protein GIB67_035747 [Kingdonia uniflora]
MRGFYPIHTWTSLRRPDWAIGSSGSGGLGGPLGLGLVHPNLFNKSFIGFGLGLFS